MSDAVGIQGLVVEPLTKFAKDSIHLVKKCTKPDHKGKSIILNIYYFKFFN